VEKFRQMEHDFIKTKNYDPMMNSIKNAGIDEDKFSPAMQNVIWSCAVQHGPGKKAILDVIKNSGVTPGDINSEAKLINAIYDVRGKLWPAGIGSRYNKERSMALSMLQMSQYQSMYAEGGKMYETNIPTTKLDSFSSYPAYKNPNTGVTQCSGTARRNFQEL